VLLPGLDGTGLLFAPLLRALSSHLRVKVIAYPPSTDMDYADLSDFAFSQLPDGPVIVLGESYSGPVAALLAYRFPERVKGLILASSFVTSPRPRFLSHLLAIPGLVHLSKIFARQALLGAYRDPEVALLLKKVIPYLPAGLIRFRVAQLLHADFSDQFLKAACPVLVVHGKQDLLVSKNHVKKLVRLRPNATVCSFEGPHMLLQVTPFECAADIVTFAARCNMDAA
jgi:pimeloyl-[acyl-carrier protein] methyl ester esterase